MLASSPNSIIPVRSDGNIEPISLSSIKENASTNAPEKPKDKPWICPASAKSLRTTNPIRAIVDPIVANIQSGEERGDGKDLISLALGDPTAAANLPPCPVAMSAVMEAISSNGHAAGYINACGLPEARAAIAKFHSPNEQPNMISAENVIVANGCSGALELALTALLDPGSILLVPQPGFPLYQVIAESHGAAVEHYRLDPDRHWECDLHHIEELLITHGSKVRGILIGNPSNPTGSVFSQQHLQGICRLAEHHRIPIVADEVYGDLTFGGRSFYPLADVVARLGLQVPVITASGLGKQYLVPGWRVGWVVFQDNIHGSLREVEAGAKRLAQVILGASHLPQRAIAPLLDPNNVIIQDWKLQLRTTLELQARFLCDKLQGIRGLDVLYPQGAMYAIVCLDKGQFNGSVQSDLDLSTLLLQEENVFVLPGSAFGVANVFRVVFCAPESILQEAAERIQSFCERHYA